MCNEKSTMVEINEKYDNEQQGQNSALSGCYAFQVGQRVKRCVNVFIPELGIKVGTVVRRYSRPQQKIGGTLLGPYPELYSVDWDDGTHGRAYLPHGIQKA